MLADGCFDLLERTCGPELDRDRAYLEGSRPREVILRLLMNLKQIYRQSGHSALLLEVLKRRIPLLHDSASEILEQGLVRVSLEDYRGARHDIEYFLRHSDDDRCLKGGLANRQP